MAEKCPKCNEKVKNGELITECPNCKTQYHTWCWNFIEKCSNCGFININCWQNRNVLSEEDKRQQQEKQRQEAEKERQEAETKRLAEEQARQKAEQEKYKARINHLKSLGRDGYYEYKVISLVDKKGAVDTERLMNELNDLGLDGWRLQCAYTNEMGKDSLQFAGFGINATADQNILIFERFVKFE